MNEKRYTVEKLELVSDHLSTRFFIKDNEEEECYDVQHIISVGFEVQYESWADKIAEKMNELNDENQHMKSVLKENNELQERNNRQAKQLDRIYKLMENKDWETLTEIIQEFEECEEQLQSELGTY